MSKPGADVASLLTSLARGGTIAPARYQSFSDLSSEDEQRVRAAWPTIPLERRLAIVTDATDLVDVDLSLDFNVLGRIALTDEDLDVRASAVTLLADTTDRRAAADLTRVLAEDPEPAIRGAAAEVLGDFMLSLETGTFDRTQGEEIAAALFARLTDPLEDVAVRAFALIAIAPLAREEVEEAISDAYYHDDRDLRLAAIEAMGRSARERWLESIDEQLQSDDPDFRYQAVVAAGEIGSQDSVDAVAALIEDDDIAVVEAAITALGEIGGPAAVEYLEDVGELDEELYPVLEMALEMAREGGIEAWIEKQGDELDDEEDDL